MAVKQGEGRTTRLLGPVYLMNFTKHDDTVGGYVEDTKYNFGIFSSAYYLDFRQASIGYTVYGIHNLCEIGYENWKTCDFNAI